MLCAYSTPHPYAFNQQCLLLHVYIHTCNVLYYITMFQILQVVLARVHNWSNPTRNKNGKIAQRRIVSLITLSPHLCTLSFSLFSHHQRICCSISLLLALRCLILSLRLEYHPRASSQRNRPLRSLARLGVLPVASRGLRACAFKCTTCAWL